MPLSLKDLRQIPVNELALQLSGRKDIDVADTLQQVEGWQRMREKVPSWAAVEGLRFPHRLALEQCSGETAARYKADVVRRLIAEAEEPTSMADLTGGFGVDFSFVARNFSRATYVERQEALCTLARHNFPLLGLPQAEVVCADGTDYLRGMAPVDLLFLDPARRDAAGRKTVMIADCEPDVCALQHTLLEKARIVVLKLSTMLDISGALHELQHVKEVHVVAVGGEAKDLLLVLERSSCGEPSVYVCENGQTFQFSYSEESNAQPAYAAPIELGQYLYEPGPATMKAGAFKLIASHFSLKKLHRNSHLYTSEELVADFPGRAFRIEHVLGFGKRDMKTLHTLTDCANLTVRNFPASVATLRKKLKLKEGGAFYLFATTLSDESHALIVCTKPDKPSSH